MYVSVQDLQPGLIVTEDVMGKTKDPIIPGNTMLTEQHIRFLRAFFVSAVHIAEEDMQEETNAGTANTSNIKVVQEKTADSPEDPLLSLYNDTLKGTKEEFNSWQSGLSVNLTRIRAMLMPLHDFILNHPERIIDLFSFSRKQEYVLHHALMISLLSASTAYKINQDRGFAFQAALAGFLADCGMSKVGLSLLAKPSPLTESEYKEIQQHTMSSYQMVKDINLLRPEAKLAIYQHHERLDGSGYPSGASGKNIALLSQIVGLADTFHALTSDRVFRKKISRYAAVEFIRHDLFGQFSLTVMNSLFSLVAPLSIGMNVRLTTGQVGKVLFLPAAESVRPIIQLKSGETINLVQSKHIAVQEAWS